MKLIHLSLLLGLWLSNSCYAMDDVIELLKGSEGLSEYSVTRANNKVTFKSKITYDNVYGSKLYMRIWVSTITLNEGEGIETADIYFGIVSVKYGDTSTGVKASPEVRIYYPDRYVIVKIRCEDMYDINYLYGLIQNGLSGYKALSVNGCGGELKWFYPKR